MSRDTYNVLAERSWVCLTSWNVLHHAAQWNPDIETSANGVTSCGRTGLLSIPGVFTRMGAPRCKQCCRRLNYPLGIGSPKNDDGCRELVEARLLALGGTCI